VPMLIWEDMLGFGSPVTRSAIPNWLFAQSCTTPDGTTLVLVYRSVWLSDDDRMYQHVKEMIDRSHSEVVMHYTVEDPQMIHGRGEWILYLLTEKSSRQREFDPTTARLLELCRTYDGEADPVHPMHANVVCLEVAIHASIARDEVIR